MIGVIVEAWQKAAVEEFFELFKTPWEFHREGETYDVVVVAGDDVPQLESKLIVVYGSRAWNSDVGIDVAGGRRQRGGMLECRGVNFPVYGEVLTLEGGRDAVICVSASDGGVAGLCVRRGAAEVIRVGYDLFGEVAVLLATGQPIEHAGIPTLDIHIQMLREWILDAGIAVVEIPPVPAGYRLVACLTHDIDFAGIGYHRCDHTMWGFLYRATVGAARNLVRRRLSLSQFVQSWRAAVSLPFVYLGWVRDFWEPFGWYLQAERGLPATYFLIPFKRRPGDKVTATHASRRGAAYDVDDLADRATTLLKEGCELGAHGIDSWHSVESGREELSRIAAITGGAVGVRMHWLLRDDSTFRVLEDAGYAYDSSVGYNEAIGYRSGTTQVFRPLGTRELLELPLHIQDGALFLPQRLDLSEAEAWRRCGQLMDHASRCGGVLTVLWHDRSHAAERFWGGFYVRLIERLKTLGAWFGTGGQVVEWFGKRRRIGFEQIETTGGAVRTGLCYRGEPIVPPVTIRVQRAQGDGLALRCVDIPWDGEAPIDLERSVQRLVPAAAGASL